MNMRRLNSFFVLSACLFAGGFSHAALVLDTFSSGSAIAELTDGETTESTGFTPVASGSFATQRELVVTTVPAGMPIGESATIEVDSVPGVFQIQHSGFAETTAYRLNINDAGWIGSPYDLTAEFPVTGLSDLYFELDFLTANLGSIEEIFTIDIVTDGGIAQFAGLMTLEGEQTLQLGYLTSTGTPDLSKVFGFEFRVDIDEGTGTSSNFVMTEMRIIPEPSSALLVAFGAGLLALRRRRGSFIAII